jgi:hypothetical protein
MARRRQVSLKHVAPTTLCLILHMHALLNMNPICVLYFRIYLVSPSSWFGYGWTCLALQSFV